MPKLSCYLGRYHRICGKFINRTGKVTQKKFLLGTDEAKAQRIADRIELLWQEVVDLHNRRMQEAARYGIIYDGEFNRITGERRLCNTPTDPIWDAEALIVAEAIRKEQASIDVPYLTNEFAAGYQAGEGAEVYLERLASLRADYKLIAFIPDPVVYAKAQAVVAEQVNAIGEDAKRLTSLTGSNATWAPGGMLHAAIDDYSDWLKNKYTRSGNLTDNGKKLVAAAARLKAAAIDMPLKQLGHDAIETAAEYWYKRPEAKLANGKSAGRPISTDTVKNMVKILRRFLRWLNRTERYQWQIAEHIITDATNGHRITDIQTEAEKKATAKGPESWTLNELVTLYRYATDRERLYILMGLNAGFAQSECGHLDRDEVHLDHDPPIMDFMRNKTGRRGGVKLWPESVKAIRWTWAEQAAAGHDKSKRALLKDNGQELDKSQIANTWNRLLDRVQKADPDFRRLSFKYLRKTSAQLMQDVGGGDSETIAIMHARAKWTGSDDQADRYYRRSLKKVYDANDRVHEHLEPMFAEAPDAFTGKRKRGGGNITTDQIKRIREVYARSGNVTKVAEQVGVSRQTVYRHLP